MLRFASVLILMFLAPALSGQSIQSPSVDTAVVNRLIEEGTQRSRIMDLAHQLTDVYGPRLTNSPQMKRANEVTLEMLREFGLENGGLHRWGPFGRGWELTRFAMHATTPYGYFPVTGFPKAWSSGHEGAVEGPVVHLKIEDASDLEAWRGKLSNSFVMVEYPAASEPAFEAVASRMEEDRLLRLANAAPPAAASSGSSSRRRAANPAALAQAQTRYAVNRFLQEERPLAVLDYGYRGWYGQIALSSASLPVEPGTSWGDAPRPWTPGGPVPVPQVTLSREHYGRLFRLVESGVPVNLEMDLQVAYHEQDLYGYNTIAEIPGTDPKLRDEVVMLGAHLDSWHSATGATDNAAGSVVMLEAVRLLRAIGAAPRRTIRIALWSGEEQGLNGSREYVYDTFARPGSDGDGEWVRTPDFEKFSAYYNIDNGTGQVRGVYLQGNEALRTLFRTWLEPFADWEAVTVSSSNTGGTDHLSFDRAGLPGFQFIQDPIEYGTMTHHSNQDSYERLVEQDLQRTAVIVASFVYHTAMLDERLPRKSD